MWLAEPGRKIGDSRDWRCPFRPSCDDVPKNVHNALLIEGPPRSAKANSDSPRPGLGLLRRERHRQDEFCSRFTTLYNQRRLELCRERIDKTHPESLC